MNANALIYLNLVVLKAEEDAGLVVHRIVRIGEDEKGWFAITKGDNSEKEDPGKVRLEQIRYVVVGILY